MNKQQLITALQSEGLRLVEPGIGAAGRRGGAGPSDHKAVTIDGTTVMVPIFTGPAATSDYVAEVEGEAAWITVRGQAIAPVTFPQQPRFYHLVTQEGIPYWQIALLHSHDVLASTVLQTCSRYGDPATACQFCAIGQSLAAGRTIARKTPEHLAEVAVAAVRLDGVKQVVLTTGTPHSRDRGAAHLKDCAEAIKSRVNLPIQAQCEPPEDFAWFKWLKTAGVDSLGMHLEAVDPQVRAQIMPGKAQVPVEYYFQAFTAAVEVFGWSQVSTYLLAGLGDSPADLLATCDKLIHMGVYPFIVPFVPISGTPLANHTPPSYDFMLSLYQQVGAMLNRAGMSSKAIKAGCAKCGACSALSTFEL